MRDSMAMNAASSTPAPASSPSVCTESQPAWLPLIAAYTASSSDAVIVVAPAPSSGWAVRRSPGAIRRRHSSATPMPIGRLTRKIQCQLSRLVSTPPSSTPTLPPPAHTKP